MAKPSAIKGRDVALFVNKPDVADPVRVGCVGDLSLDINTESDEATCSDSEGWKEFIPGQMDWSINANLTARTIEAADADANVSVDEFVQYQIDQEILTVRFSVGSTRYSGQCFITKNGFKGQQKGAATAAVSLQGTGALVKVA